MKAVNLIPAEQRGAGGGGGLALDAASVPALLVLVLLVGLAVLALLYGVADHQVSSRKAQIASINEQTQATQARASELAPYVSFKQMYQQRLQNVSTLVGTRFDWAHAFHELGRVLPSGASLITVHGAVGSTTGAGSSSSSSSSSSHTGGAVTSATPAGTIPTLLLTGCATSQSEVAQVLQRLRLMDGVIEVSLQSSAKGSSSSGASSGNGGCPPHDPAFSATVAFSPLPNPPTIPAPSGSTATASSAETGSSSSGASASTTGKGAQ